MANGRYESTGRLGRPFGGVEEVQDPYAINTPMAQVDPRSNPYGQGGGLRGRLRDALLAGGSAGHNKNRMAPVMNARMFDRGMAPEQQNYMAEQRAQQEYQQQQQDRVDGKKNKVSAYTDYLRQSMARGEKNQMSMRSWLSMSDADMSEVTRASSGLSKGYGSRPAASLQEMKMITHHQALASGATDQNDPQWNDSDTWLRSYWQNRRGAKIETVNGVPVIIQPGANGYGGQPVASTIPQGAVNPPAGETPSERAGIVPPGTGVTMQQALDGEMDAARQMSQAEIYAKQDADNKINLGTSLDIMEEQHGRLLRLRDMVSNSDASTGLIGQNKALYDSEYQALKAAFLTETWKTVADMKKGGMTFGEFTDSEFVRIMETVGSLGRNKDANLSVLDKAIEEMEVSHNLYSDRYDNPTMFTNRKRQRLSQRNKNPSQAKPGSSTGGGAKGRNPDVDSYFD